MMVCSECKKKSDVLGFSKIAPYTDLTYPADPPAPSGGAAALNSSPMMIAFAAVLLRFVWELI